MWISTQTWKSLVEANERAVAEGWAEPGVFGTGVGPLYEPGSPHSVLYVGKSAGPLGGDVGYSYDQALSYAAARDWMVQRRNARSAFWQFIERIDPTRRQLAWTNVCKMDRVGGGSPPSGRQWAAIAAISLQALREEVETLEPAVTVFATSEQYRPDIDGLLSSMGYQKDEEEVAPLTRVYRHQSGKVAITTRHAQGWNTADRDLALAAIASERRAEAAAAI